MITTSPARKVFQGVATRQQMFRLVDRHAKRPDRFDDSDASSLFAGEWFEIDETLYDYMLNRLPPLWMRGPIFALREYLARSVTSVFFSLEINEALRYFHAYCDLSDRASVEAVRIAITDRESRPVRAVTREERLEHIWSTTADDYRGYRYTITCSEPTPIMRSTFQSRSHRSAPSRGLSTRLIGLRRNNANTVIAPRTPAGTWHPIDLGKAAALRSQKSVRRNPRSSAGWRALWRQRLETISSRLHEQPAYCIAALHNKCFPNGQKTGIPALS